MGRLVALSLSLALIPGLASAQVAVGNIAVTGLSDQQFSILDPVSGNSIPYPLSDLIAPGVSDWTQCIRWDADNPNDFYVGGNGFIGRLTITGLGTSSYQLITNQVGIISEVSIDDDGSLVCVDSTSNQVIRVDANTGAITPITSGPQPWGTDANCGALDPTTGDIWVGSNKALYRIVGGVGTPVLYSSGWSSGGSAYCSGIAVDGLTGEVYISVLTAELVARVEPNGSLTNLAPPHSVKQPNGLAFDQNGDLVVCGGANLLNTVDRVPRNGGTPTPLGQIAGQFFLASGITVVLDTCPGDVEDYGQGCAGTGGFTPAMTLSGCAAPGEVVSIDIANGLGGAPSVIFFGLGQSAIPMGAGCTLNVFPLLAPTLSFPLLGSGAGDGNMTLQGIMPAGTSGLIFTMQLFVADPASPIGAAASNGVKVTIG
ncbi:MAG: hypothetical protein IPH13_09785 [Planctomycetes bacterium]|nr:hypothetical protein [Planctomycetota bacterium]MCC7171842.1 hypothetical protein [Planctomycetota bacterium]